MSAAGRHLTAWLPRFVALSVVVGAVVSAAVLIGPGMQDNSDASLGTLDLVWGRRGVSLSRFQKPRAMVVDHAHDLLYVVDMKAHIQVFDLDGNFIRGWQTPEFEFGRPSGLSLARDGNLLVADTHYHRILVYAPDGTLLDDRTLGGRAGPGPGEFGFVTGVAQDSQGNLYVSEYGEYDRIQKFSPDGTFLLQWGGHGSEPGQFVRPQKIAIDQHDHVWVTDACNHRIQVFDATGTEAKLVRIWGEQGTEPGQLSYPYDLDLDGQGHVYICEYGNHRVQKFTLDGRALGTWGTHGRGEGQLHNPWAARLDRHARLHVLDSNNHRVQRVVLN